LIRASLKWKTQIVRNKRSAASRARTDDTRNFFWAFMSDDLNRQRATVAPELMENTGKTTESERTSMKCIKCSAEGGLYSTKTRKPTAQDRIATRGRRMCAHDLRMMTWTMIRNGANKAK
jgi:hypothetical protein